MSASVRAEKAALRRDLLGRRAQRDGSERDAAADAIALHALATPALLRGERIACYLSFGDELDTSALIAELRGRGLEVIVPLSRPADRVLDWAVVDEAGTTPGAHGIPEPTGKRLGAEGLAQCRVAFIPALAVDHAGRRLGRGAGYYDRALAGFRGLVCAIVFADELLPEVPAEPHDMPVHLALTPAGIFRPERSP